jgi:hypothetical protein
VYIAVGVRTLALCKRGTNVQNMNGAKSISIALKHPARKRKKIAEEPPANCESPSRSHLDTIWAQESEARIDAFLAGKIATVPGERVLRR